MSDPRIPTLRFFPDWGHPWSIWDSVGGGAVDPATYGISAALRRRLELWTDHWSENFDPFTGWKSEEARVVSSTLGDEIFADLQTELAPTAQVIDLR